MHFIVHAAFVRIKSMTRMMIIPDVQSNPETHPITQTQTLTVGQISGDGRFPEETSDSSGGSSSSGSGGTQSR